MNYRSLPTRLLILCAIISAFAFNTDSNSFSFSLSTERVFGPGDADIRIQFSSNGLGPATIRLRAYRVKDPVAFFMEQKDPHSPRMEGTKAPNTFDMIGVGMEKVRRDIRYAARDVMPEQSRRALRDVSDLNGTKARQNTPKPVAPPANNKDLPAQAERFELVAEWEERITPEDSDWHYQNLNTPLREKGVYMIEGRIRGKKATAALIISEYGLVVKQSDDAVLTWVVNKRTGQKIPDVPITCLRGGEKIAEDESDGDGLLNIELPPLPKIAQASDDEEEYDWYWEYRRRQLVMMGEKDGNFFIHDPYSYSDGGDSRYKVYLHTDRPVYRPAQSVFYRGIVRKIAKNGEYQNYTASPVFIEVQDANDGAIRRDTLALSDLGTFNGQLDLADEIPLGYYTIKATVDSNDYWFNFSVEEYKKPEYKVVVSTDRKQYTRGDEITATVQADYFFGSPVANAEVEYFVYRSRYWRPWWKGSEWEYLYEEGGDYDSYRMEMVESDTGRLAPDGSFSFRYKTDDSSDADYVYRIQANVVDNSRRSISGAKSVEVTRGMFYLTLRTNKYVYRTGDEASISVKAATFDGDKPVGTDLRVSVTQISWDRVFTDSTDGVANYRYDRREQNIWSGTGETESDGNGTITYNATKPGYLKITVTARDERGADISESDYIYISDESYANWYREGASDIQIIPDKESYQPGETMNALVIMPAAGIDALITSEANNILTKQVERLSTNSAVVHLTIQDQHAPMFFLEATALVNDQLYTESRRITVVPRGKLIRLQVETDKTQYRPGDHGSVTVRAMDENGSPVSNVDVALGMVDEAIYSIRPESAPDIQRFFYGPRWSSVWTSASLDFSFYGDARAARTARGDDLFGEARSYKQTADRGRHNIAYGDVKGEMFVQPAVRRNFKDMMFWTPSARTGSDGRAVLNVEFPDNLTTWRITARGITANTAVGQTVARVISRKELLVRMETPRFMVQGDQMVIATTIHNYLKGEKVAKVEFAGENVTLADRQRTITIPANGEQRIDWKVSPANIGTAKLTVKALTNEESDAMELSVPVIPRGVKAGDGGITEIPEANGTRTVNLTMPESAQPGTGEAYVTISPSAASSIIGSLDQLIGYPYGCVEQTMSRFLPTIVVAQLLKDFNLSLDPKKQEVLPKMVSKSLAKLYGFQHNDGGWGWWENDETHPYMTAYVMYGLTIAKQAGYPVIDDRYLSGLTALNEQIEKGRNSAKDPMTWTEQGYMLYVAAYINRGQPHREIIDRITELAANTRINNYTLALLALASSYQGETTLARGLADRLEQGKSTSGNLVFWQSESRPYSWANDDVEASAFAVKAILALRGRTEAVDGTVRWLLSRRRDDGWHNTRQTATVIYALTDYLKLTNDLSPDYTLTVNVNGSQAFSGRITRADLFKEAVRVKVPQELLRSGTNTITFQKSGNGSMFGAARLNYFATGPNVVSSSAGFHVSRQYYLLSKEKVGEKYIYQKRAFGGTAKSGDELLVKVKVRPDQLSQFCMVESPIPAGCEVVANTDGYTIPGERDYDEAYRRQHNIWGWYWWFSGREIRDEKVAFFAREMDAREYEFSYILRAQIPGRWTALPTMASLMYYQEVRGTGGMEEMTITD